MKSLIKNKNLWMLFACSTFIVLGCRHRGSESSLQNQGITSQSNVLPWPSRGRFSSPFGMRGGRMHKGIDIAAARGTKIRSVRSGVVEYAGWMRGYGKTVIVNHYNFKTLYAHCYKIYVSKGQNVSTKQVVGTIGRTGNATGNHLHFEYRTMDNKALNPLPFMYRAANQAVAKN